MKNLLVDLKSGDKIKVKVRDVVIGDKEKIFISGPCSVEDYDTMYGIAKSLKEKGVNILRGGAFKPRTSPYDFQGLGFEGLNILKEVSEKVGIPVVSEIMDTRQVQKALDYIDMIQIGSRTMYNYDLLKAVGRSEEHTSELQSRQYLVCRLLL